MGMQWILALVLFATGGPQGPAATKHGLNFYFIDVEGGAATLIVTPRGESVLIDCGSPGPRDAGRIYQVARSAGIKAIDHLIQGVRIMTCHLCQTGLWWSAASFPERSEMKAAVVRAD